MGEGGMEKDGWLVGGGGGLGDEKRSCEKNES